MPPKSKKDAAAPLSPAGNSPPATSAADPNISSQLAELFRIVNSYAHRFDKLEGMLAEAKKENVALKKTVEDRDKEITRLNEKLNDLEQYGRLWSVRILDLELPKEDLNIPERVMVHVYRKALLPILQGAKDKGLINSIPAVEELLETAHILPAKPDTVNPIIARFYTRNIRNMVLRLKRDHAPRHSPDSRPSRGEFLRPGKFLYPIYEDLTRVNFHKMRALAQHEHVESCWTVNGALKYKLKNNTNIFRVKSVFMSVEDILK
jgi:hypothetical protein